MKTSRKHEGRIEAVLDRKGGPIYATDESRQRAVKLFEDVCRSARECGFELCVPTEGHKRGTFLARDGYLIEVYVRETQRERVVDRRRVHEPTGRLSFHIGHVYLASGGGPGSRDVVWRDGLRMKLEHRVDKIVARIEEEYASLTEWDRRKAASQQVEAEKAQEEKEARERQGAEEARFDLLVRQVEGWELSQRIRAFVNEAEQCYLALHGQIQAGSEADEWVRWARARAEEIDPLKELRGAAATPQN